ncbi:MAG: NIPSNAP family protein [Planctomycetales bacterium]|nr:NIPSNAP family protein [Planctomycetales bacterium]
MLLRFVSCTLSLLALISITAILAAQDRVSDGNQPPISKLYELRFYTCNPGKLPDLHARFRDHTMGLFEKHGMENIIYWTVQKGTEADGQDADNMLVYIIAHKDEDARQASWQAFINDPEWKAVQTKSEENGKLLSKAPRAILMHATDFSPADESSNRGSDAAARLWELRQYNDGPERVPHTTERFAFGERDLFVEAGMQTVSFWEADDKSAFIYLLAHKDQATAEASWQKFFGTFRPFMEKYRAAHPDLPRGRGNGSEVRFLVPTDYSPRK